MIFSRKLSLDERGNLEEQKAHGRMAAHAWDSYMRTLLTGRRKEIFDAFSKSRPDDVETLMTLRHLLAAVDDIEKAILIDIERGEFAAKQLNEDNDDN